jgi:hypothetical protein
MAVKGFVIQAPELVGTRRSTQLILPFQQGFPGPYISLLLFLVCGYPRTCPWLKFKFERQNFLIFFPNLFVSGNRERGLKKFLWNSKQDNFKTFFHFPRWLWTNKLERLSQKTFSDKLVPYRVPTTMALSIRGLSVTLSIILSSAVMLSNIFLIVILSVETPYNDTS